MVADIPINLRFLAAAAPNARVACLDESTRQLLVDTATEIERLHAQFKATQSSR